MKKKKKHRIFQKIVIFFIFSLLIYGAYYYFNYYNKIDETVKLEETIKLETSSANITNYYIYGTHFNIEGTLEIDSNEYTNITLVLKNTDKEIKLNTVYNVTSTGIDFYLSDKINDGLYLDDLEEGNYILLLKISNAKEDLYYSLTNTTGNDNIDYYTISNNSKSKYIKIKQNVKFINKSNFKFIIKKVTLPDNIYDIVIDAGHGGEDAGAVSGKYYEANITYDYAVDLAAELEDLGYKVLLTRTDKNANVNIYDVGGRVYTTTASRAKLALSLHLNSADGTVSVGGVEIFTANNINYSFAQLLADNIVSIANTTYSGNDTYQVSKGVYTRNFSLTDIASFKAEARADGYAFYDTITTTTPYYYMIRETGGFITGAYMDGRDSDYGTNKYYDSLVGIETYIIELGYIINDTDLNNILNNEDLYLEAIITSINNYNKNK